MNIVCSQDSTLFCVENVSVDGYGRDIYRTQNWQGVNVRILKRITKTIDDLKNRGMTVLCAGDTTINGKKVYGVLYMDAACSIQFEYK